jgi:integrase/recombinase XerC
LKAIRSDDAARLLRYARTARDRALLVLLWRGGLRNNEARSVELHDVEWHDDGSATVHVMNPKGGKRKRATGIGAEYAQHLRAWVAERGIAPGPLLCTTTGAPLQTSQVRRMVKQMQRRAGVSGRVHPHAFRHTFATECAREGVDVKDIQVLLGHASLATTDIYLSSLGATRAVEVARKRNTG